MPTLSIHRPLNTITCELITGSTPAESRPFLDTANHPILVTTQASRNRSSPRMPWSEYRDFNLGRMVAIRVLDEALPSTAGADVAWETQVKARTMPHSALGPEYIGLVRQEYFPGASAWVLTGRGPLLHYTLQAIQVVVDPQTQTPPQYLLELDKPDGLRRWLFASG